MTREEMISKMEALGIDGGSKLNMRSEAIQRKQQVRRIPRLAKKIKKKSKLLIVADLAVPFNPETGEKDDMFNEVTKYRPAFSATSVALLLKGKAAENQKLKSSLMRRAGVSEWDTSNVETFTKADWEIFYKYRVPRVFTIPVVSIDIPVMNNGPFGRDYAIDVKRDPDTGEVVGELPAVLKAYNLFRDLAYEEVAEYNEKVKRGELKKTEKQQKDDRRVIFNKNPFSDDHPANYLQIIELPLTNNYNLSGDVNFKAYTADDIRQFLVQSRESKKLRNVLEEYLSGNLEQYDTHFDFYEIDMSCPQTGDESTNEGKMEIGQDTVFEKPGFKLSECPDDGEATALIRDFIDSDPEIETTMLRSLYITKYDESIGDQVITSLHTVMDLSNDYLTDAVILRHREIISEAFGEEGELLIESADADISGREKGITDSERKSINEEIQAYDLESGEFTGDGLFGEDEVDVELLGSDNSDDKCDLPFN